jgi:hypothetical protein
MPSTAQPAPETDEKKSRGLGSYVLWAFVAVMVYVLSSGPVMRLCGERTTLRRGNYAAVVYTSRGYPPWTRIYTPLDAAYNETVLRRPLGMHWHLWCPGTYDANGEVVWVQAFDPKELRLDRR